MLYTQRIPLIERFFALTGDGELQEGLVWEAVMYAPKKRLDNLCMIIDKNNGQLDEYKRLHFDMDNLGKQLEAFGWKVVEVDGTRFDPIVEAMEDFVNGVPDGKPLAIISDTYKGFGAFAEELDKHKVTLGAQMFEQEVLHQKRRRDNRVVSYKNFLKTLQDRGLNDLVEILESKRSAMYLPLDESEVDSYKAKVLSKKVPPRDKHIAVDVEKITKVRFIRHCKWQTKLSKSVCNYMQTMRGYSQLILTLPLLVV